MFLHILKPRGRFYAAPTSDFCHLWNSGVNLKTPVFKSGGRPLFLLSKKFWSVVTIWQKPDRLVWLFGVNIDLKWISDEVLLLCFIIDGDECRNRVREWINSIFDWIILCFLLLFKNDVGISLWQMLYIILLWKTSAFFMYYRSWI